jgi:hypothetical protein
MLNYLSTKRDVDLGMLTAVPLTDRIFTQASVDICVQEARNLPVAVKEFVEHLHQVFSADVAESAERSRRRAGHR